MQRRRHHIHRPGGGRSDQHAFPGDQSCQLCAAGCELRRELRILFSRMLQRIARRVEHALRLLFLRIRILDLGELFDQAGIIHDLLECFDDLLPGKRVVE